MKSEQVTAWALNELSADEKAQIEALLQEDGEARQQAAQTKEFCDFLTSHLLDSKMELSAEQREQLQRAASEESTTTVKDNNVSVRGQKWQTWPYQSKLKNLYAIAATLTVIGTAAWLVIHEDELRTPHPQEVAKARLDAKPLSESESVRVAPALALAPAEPQIQQKKRELNRLGNLTEGYSKDDKADLEKKAATAETSTREEGGDVDSLPQAPKAPKLAVTRPMTGTVAAAPAGAVPAPKTLAADTAPNVVVPQIREGSSNESASGRERRATQPSAVRKYPESGGFIAGYRLFNDGNIIYNEGKVDKATPAGAAGPVASTTPPNVRLREADADDVPTDKARPVSEASESYTSIQENVLQDVVRAPLSTFSIDVDTAAYANVRRFLNQNSAPPPDAVRLEELINYFPTNEDGPGADAKEPFAVRVEMAACPWQTQHRLARIAIKGRELGHERKPCNLVFLVDVSGSMNEPNKLPLVKQSLRMLTEKLGDNDRVTMVTYAGNSGLALPPTSGKDKDKILAAIDRLESGGSTNGSAGIRLAYEKAREEFKKGDVNRVILCTDGDFNVGVSSPEELERLITEKARSGVFLSVLGFGAGNLKDRTMETLADKGNGNYAYIDSLSEARKVLVEQMSGTLVTIAKDVKIQMEFNPAQVRSYRLIGYENRLLSKEDFNDDTKDAGEIGAGHSVTALYELVPANLPPGAEPPALVDKLKYQRQAAPLPALGAAKPADGAATSNEAFTVKLRYKEPEGTESKLIEIPVTDNGHDGKAASGEFKFSAAVAGFGLLLRDSSYAGSLKWEQVRQLAIEGKGTDALGYRGEFLQLIEKARGLTKR